MLRMRVRTSACTSEPLLNRDLRRLFGQQESFTLIVLPSEQCLESVHLPSARTLQRTSETTHKQAGKRKRDSKRDQFSHPGSEMRPLPCFPVCFAQLSQSPPAPGGGGGLREPSPTTFTDLWHPPLPQAFTHHVYSTAFWWYFQTASAAQKRGGATGLLDAFMDRAPRPQAGLEAVVLLRAASLT